MSEKSPATDDDSPNYSSEHPGSSSPHSTGSGQSEKELANLRRTEIIAELVEGAAARQAEQERMKTMIEGHVLELQDGKFISAEIKTHPNGGKYLLLNEGFQYQGNARIASSIPYPAIAFGRLMLQLKSFADTFYKRGDTRFGNLPKKKPVLELYEKGHIGYAAFLDRVKNEHAMVLCFKNVRAKPTVGTITICKSEIGRVEMFLQKYRNQL